MHPATRMYCALLVVSSLAVPALVQAADPEQLVRDLSTFQFDQLGNPQLRWDVIPPVYASDKAPHQQLVILVEFADRTLDRYADKDDQGERLQDYYQERLFDDDYEERDTLSHYYATQSLGQYHVTGKVLLPVRVSKSRADYGMPIRPEGGDWRNDAAPDALAVEALELAVANNPKMDWSAFDRWDPTDFDGDGILGESDGYLDHLVIVFAGGGQSSCQLLNKIGDTLNPNAAPDAIGQLDDRAKECAERIWPHRSMLKMNEGQGPQVEGWTNGMGGVRLTDSMWARDYNMQSEYTDISTFIHEFGHSIGLPDIYSRTSSNSTGSWEVMSGTTSPSPQNLSAWSRLMLGWLQPIVVLPPEFGGKKVQSAYLRTLDDEPRGPKSETADRDQALARSVMVVLPPKKQKLVLVDLPKKSGEMALYSGQGNELERAAELRLDLTGVESPKAKDALLSFDAWWDIEGGWDFAYLETSLDEGRSWTRRTPTDRKYMPAKHGHDGKETLPGFTGYSGDFDGDGKNESNRKCNPKSKVAYGEDKAGQGKDPCTVPSWVRVAFDLSDLAGRQARVRLRYYTDMAAVQRGILIDNVRLPMAGIDEDFEERASAAWRMDGFSKSPGEHELLVPHFYLLEYRDPYAKPAPYRYDTALAKDSYSTLQMPDGELRLVQFKPRPGVVAWYYNGAYAWSENDPAGNGPGKGYLLALDANPNEHRLPGWETYFRGSSEAFDSHYDVKAEAAQKAIEPAYLDGVCFARNQPYWPKDFQSQLASRCKGETAGSASLTIGGKPLVYSYEVINELLPGRDRNSVQKLGEMLDYRVRKGQVQWRMRDRSLRHYHTYDAPFSLEPFDGGVKTFVVSEGQLQRRTSTGHPAVAKFSDADPTRWLNPKLPFGGVAVPTEGFGFELAHPKGEAPKGARVKVYFTWDR